MPCTNKRELEYFKELPLKHKEDTFILDSSWKRPSRQLRRLQSLLAYSSPPTEVVTPPCHKGKTSRSRPRHQRGRKPSCGPPPRQPWIFFCRGVLRRRGLDGPKRSILAPTHLIQMRGVRKFYFPFLIAPFWPGPHSYSEI